MPVVKKNTNKKEETYQYSITVLRAHEFENGNIAIDLAINGVVIRGATHIDYKDKNTGETKSFISWPSRKVDDAYYPYVSCKLSDEDVEKIEKQIAELLN